MTIGAVHTTTLRWPDGRVSTAGADGTRARVPDVPIPPAERTRLAGEAGVGGVLRRERVARGWSQRQLEAAGGFGTGFVSYLEAGLRRPSESTTRRFAETLRSDESEVRVAMLDLELRRAAGESLRRWRRRPWSARRQRVYDEAVRRLDGDRAPDPAGRLVVGRLLAALSPRGERSE